MKQRNRLGCIFKQKRFTNILRVKLEEKRKILKIDIVDGDFKKFPDKRNKKE